MRRLATVRTISDISPIDGADHIELAIVDGWQCVVRKGAFTVGQLVIYCEIDTLLPVLPQYEFLRKGCYVQRDWLPTPNSEGYRLRTIKLRKQISQGLLLDIPEGMTVVEGDDVTDALGIYKWDPPVHAGLAGNAKGNFPPYINKTDQERVQNIKRKVFSDALSEVLWEVTLKLDGSSCTFYHKDDVVGVCSRNIDLKLDQDTNAYVNIFHRLEMADKLPSCGNIAIQGELMGPGIQGNREGLRRHEYYAFDVWDIDHQCYLPRGEQDAIISYLGLQHVPVLHQSTTLQGMGIYTIQDMLDYADRPSLNHRVAEGVVFKDVVGSKQSPLYSFKCINNVFLLSDQE